MSKHEAIEILNSNTVTDSFELDDKGFALAFPCCVCKHRRGSDIDEPCCKCGHNAGCEENAK